ncbi:hypothetical protein GCM10009862_31490 [Microbacterium binotii]|uniref:Uncharacterized protein n=1 Tax=Microbacterium binotii TaxID=462710 RepID=A0ABN3PM75_9MICO
MWSGNSKLAGILVILLHSVMLWVLIPVGFVAWLVCVPFTFPRPVRLGSFLAWLAFNNVVLLQRVLFRPWFRTPSRWLAPREMRDVKHRISLHDLFLVPPC